MKGAVKPKSTQDLLLARLAVGLTEYGFNPRPEGQSFYKQVPGGLWSFHVSIIRHSDDFDVTADVAVRLDALEDLVNAHDSNRPTAYKRRSMTLGAELGNIAGTGQMRWTVDTDEAIEDVATAIMLAFREIGIPFLTCSCELTEAFRVLSSTNPKETLYSPVEGSRYMRALAAASLLRLPEVSAIAQQYELRLAEKKDLYYECFHSLRAALGL